MLAKKCYTIQNSICYNQNLLILTMINNYDKMQGVHQSLDIISKSVANKEGDEVMETELVLLPSVSQNKKTVSGIVKDENGEPIIGANVTP